MSNYCLIRILGNDLPPRHGANQHLDNLKFILENEPSFESCEKIWLVNRVVDSSVEAALISLLETHRRKYFVIPFSMQGYDHAWSKDQKISFIIKINQARNYIIEQAKQIAPWSVLVDGSHFFTQAGWSELVEKIEDKSFNLCKVDTYRLKQNNKEVFNFDLKLYKKDEAVIAYHAQSAPKFNEDLAYGSRDKIELLARYQDVPFAGYCLRLHDNTHLGFIRWMRERDRNLALDNLIKIVENIYKQL